MIKKLDKVNNISIIIPVYNEEGNIALLVEEIERSILKSIKYEIIIVDDGSTDNTPKRLKNLKIKNRNIIILRHRKNYGQSYSLRTGILYANEDFIITLDGDGQNDPKDINKLLNNFSVDKDFQLVIGNRKKRHDKLSKKLASRFAFLIRKIILQDKTPDTGCAMKVFRKKDFILLPFFNHIHRFFPVLFRSYGGNVVSVPVNHRERLTGTSKYTNFQRALVGIYDLIGVVWLSKRSYSPNFIKVKKIISNKER